MEGKMETRLNMRAFVSSYNLITALGEGVEKNTQALLNNASGVVSSRLFPELPEYPLGKIAGRETEKNTFYFDILLEKGIQLISKENTIEWTNPKLLVILSTTKGNIESLQHEESVEKSKLYKIAESLQEKLGLIHTPEVISNACISGVSALIWGQRYIKTGHFEKVVVIGIDTISKFILSGFHSFMALSDEKSKPFDAKRKGLNLGEAIGIVYLTNENTGIEITGGGMSNDANHISGPSRTGDGLAIAIQMAMKEAQISSSQIDYVSAHGTATPYNDEMECKAFQLVELGNTPVNSYKGYIGHTLGAAGIVETIFSLESLKHQTLFASLGYEEHGVSAPLAVITQNKTSEIKTILKTASGFGGGNSALIIQKI